MPQPQQPVLAHEIFDCILVNTIYTQPSVNARHSQNGYTLNHTLQNIRDVYAKA